MLMEAEQCEHTLVIHVKEDRLMANLAAEFRSTIAEIVEEGNDSIILDLAQVRFLDSSGLGAIVSVRKMVGPKGSLLLCGLTEQVDAVFRLTRMDAVFEIFDDTTLALAA